MCNKAEQALVKSQHACCLLQSDFSEPVETSCIWLDENRATCTILCRGNAYFIGPSGCFSTLTLIQPLDLEVIVSWVPA